MDLDVCGIAFILLDLSSLHLASVESLGSHRSKGSCLALTRCCGVV